jgi:hypothetical protein
MAKLFYLAAFSVLFISCNNSDSSKSSDADSTKNKEVRTNMIEVPPELTVTPEQVNTMLENYNSGNVEKAMTSVLEVNVGWLNTAIDKLEDAEIIELIFGGYTKDDFVRRQPIYPTVPETEALNRSCIIFRNPNTGINYDITTKLCPPPVGACDVSFFAQLKDSSRNRIVADVIKIPDNLEITAADVNAMLANYNSENVSKESANILGVNVGYLRSVLEKLDDADKLHLIFGGYTDADFKRRQPTYPSLPRASVVNIATLVFRNDGAKQNFDITTKLCPPPVGSCNISFFKDLKTKETKK